MHTVRANYSSNRQTFYDVVFVTGSLDAAPTIINGTENDIRHLATALVWVNYLNGGTGGNTPTEVI